MFRVTPIVLCLGLAACMSEGEHAAQQCTKLGYSPGSTEYANCYRHDVLTERRKWQAISDVYGNNAAQMSNNIGAAF